jgi:hypothetical protein
VTHIFTPDKRLVTSTLPKGPFLWDKDEAVKQESIKKCRRNRDCALLDGKCAFCNDVGKKRGIYYNSRTKQVLDPDGCTDLKTVVSSCDRTTLSSDGIVVTGSACSAGVTKDCLVAMYDQKGLGQQALLRLYTQGKTASIVELLEILNTEEALKTSRTTFVQTDFSGTGSATVAQVTAKLDVILAYATSGRYLAKDTAILLTQGTNALPNGANYDVCNYFPYAFRTKGLEATATKCLQQEFRKAGCQASGTAYPTTGTLRSFAGNTLAEIRARFGTLFGSMQSAKLVSEQRDAFQKCLGITLTDQSTPSTGRFCGERGIEYFVFSNITLVGRIISKAGLLKDPDMMVTNSDAKNLKELLTNAKSPSVSYRARTTFSIPAGGSMWGSWYMVQNTYTVDVNSSPQPVTVVQGGATKNGLIQNECRVTFPATGDVNVLTISYKGAKGANFGDPSFAYISNNLPAFQLYQASKKPILSFSFSSGSITDDNQLGILTTGVLQTLTQTGKDGQTDVTKKGVKATGDAFMTNIRVQKNMVRVVSCSVYLGEKGRVFGFMDTENYTESLNVYVGGLTYTIAGITKTVYSEALVNNAWVKLAVAYSYNSLLLKQIVDIYVNNTSVGTLEFSYTPSVDDVRPLQLQILESGKNLVMERLYVYDPIPISGSGTEGFTGSTSTTFGSVSALLKDEGSTTISSVLPNESASATRDSYIVPTLAATSESSYVGCVYTANTDSNTKNDKIRTMLGGTKNASGVWTGGTEKYDKKFQGVVIDELNAASTRACYDIQ